MSTNWGCGAAGSPCDLTAHFMHKRFVSRCWNGGGGGTILSLGIRFSGLVSFVRGLPISFDAVL